VVRRNRGKEGEVGQPGVFVAAADRDVASRGPYSIGTRTEGEKERKGEGRGAGNRCLYRFGAGVQRLEKALFTPAVKTTAKGGRGRTLT